MSTDLLGPRRVTSLALMTAGPGVEGDKRLIFVGNDWAEDHHNVEVMDDAGRTLARRRLSEKVPGWAYCMA